MTWLHIHRCEARSHLVEKHQDAVWAVADSGGVYLGRRSLSVIKKLGHYSQRLVSRPLDSELDLGR